MSIITQEIRDRLTPDQALEMLLEGNQRFINQDKNERDELSDAVATADGQFPYAVVVSCIDSRTSSEIIFDQGIGDIFLALMIKSCKVEERNFKAFKLINFGFEDNLESGFIKMNDASSFEIVPSQ